MFVLLQDSQFSDGTKTTNNVKCKNNGIVEN